MTNPVTRGVEGERVKAGRYLRGNPYSRFALLIYPKRYWRLPWQRPLGGWLIWRLGFWWDGGASKAPGQDAPILLFPKDSS